ncbi:MAG: hypothetical protein LBN00_08130 [Oscillospiraceae bacterium]|jgi:hypothetical protein|nr:hypothetical protein [Oscillospiraceae bacterium]
MRIRAIFRDLKEDAVRRPKLFALYFILRLLVIGVLVLQVTNANWDNVLWCIVTLILFTLPSFLEKRVKIDIPDTLEVIVLFFAFAAEILGEIAQFYKSVPLWDTILHTSNGFLAAAIGLALIDILNREERFAINLSPRFVGIFAFCFSMTIGVIWEFFEFFMDTTFGMDMQKDTIIDGVYDIGLIDTMKDLIVNFIGALVFSILGYFYIKNRGRGKHANFVRRFVMTKIDKSDEDKNM